MPSNELYHYGVLGMRWGVRRYQNEDGTLTAAGKRRQKYAKVEKAVDTAKRIVRSGESEADRKRREKVEKERTQELDRYRPIPKRQPTTVWKENGNEHHLSGISRDTIEKGAKFLDKAVSLTGSVKAAKTKFNDTLGRRFVEKSGESENRLSRLNRHAGAKVDGVEENWATRWKPGKIAKTDGYDPSMSDKLRKTSKGDGAAWESEDRLKKYRTY